MDQRKAKKGAPAPEGEYWGVDPHDVRRHAQRMREARAVGPLGKFSRIAAVVVVLVGAFLVYWNFDTLRELEFDFARISDAFEDAVDDVEDATRDEPGTEVVGDTSIAGVSMPTSIEGEKAPDAAPPADPVTPPAAAPVATEPVPTPEPVRPSETAAAIEEPRPVPPPEPEVPAGPETFGFGVETMSVSEANASARVLVLRDGGRRQVSFIRWWTTDGTAVAGSDFARLEPRTERFGVGEQNRTLLIPIIGDRMVEGPETFYVEIAVGEGAEPVPVGRIEIIINDDD